MPDEYRAPVPGAAVVCLHNDSVLLIKRGREPNYGRWSFPGGKIEPGERGRDAAAREALEETGLRVQVLDAIDFYDALFPPYHYAVIDYLAVPIEATAPVAGEDAMDARWVPIAETAAYDLTPEMHTVLQRAQWLLRRRDDSPPSLGVAVGRPVAPRDRVRGLYVITDETIGRGRSHLELAAAALAGGAQLVQLRDKHADAGDLFPVALEMARLCREHSALFIVNDRIDLAEACGADGVHLGQTDLPLDCARRLLGPCKLIGVSVEDVAQVEAAIAAGADYLGVGPIFGTASKADAGEAVGLEQIRRFRQACDLPIVAIGGITAENAASVIAAGAESAAVIGAVCAAAGPTVAAQQLAALFPPAE